MEVVYMSKHAGAAFLIACALLVLFAGCQKKVEPGKWEPLFEDATWNKFPAEELKDYAGTIAHSPPTKEQRLAQRYNPYKLILNSRETVDIYCCGSNALKAYVDRKVILRGKVVELEVEGELFREIWPTAIKCRE
jgi:hypothetical protein